jgi:DNA-binding response OmpR family regulator
MKALFVAERTLVESLRAVLTEDGVAVDVAEQPARADFKVQSQDYDVVLLDPRRLGGRAHSHLLRWRRQGLRSHVVVLLPGDCDSGERAEALDAGADGCLLRPLCPQELCAYLRAVRRRLAFPSASSSVWRVHDLEINTQTHTVSRSGRPIPLTPREFELLQLLAYRQGEVVTRAEILEHLYDGQEEITGNLVDVYIRYLRKKIDRNSDNPLILTRWGKGYLLRAQGS